MRDKKPGELSDDLRIALGMPVGPVSTSLVWKSQFEEGDTADMLRALAFSASSSVLFSERSSVSATLADRNATLWTAAELSEFESSWLERAYTGRLFIWIPRRWLGQTSC